MHFRTNGFFLADTMFGMALVVTLIGILGLAVNQHGKASTRLAHRRAAARLAEHTLTSLAVGMPVPSASSESDGQTRIVVRNAPDGETVDGYQWIEVEVAHR